jgi:hypothetical protein
MEKYKEYYSPTNEKQGLYNLLKCKVCLWAFAHQVDLGIIVDVALANKTYSQRKKQLVKHVKDYPSSSTAKLQLKRLTVSCLISPTNVGHKKNLTITNIRGAKVPLENIIKTEVTLNNL